MSDSKLTLEIKNVYGRLCAYPRDAFLTSLLALKDTVSKSGTRKKAKCFTVHDMPALKQVAEQLDAELVEVNLLKGEALHSWHEQQSDKTP